MSVPRQRRTASRTPPTLSDSERDFTSEREPDGEEDGTDGQEPWLSRLLNRASSFADVISQNHYPSPHRSWPRRGRKNASSEPEDADRDVGHVRKKPDVMGILGHDLARMAQTPDTRAMNSSPTMRRLSTPPLQAWFSASWLRRTRREAQGIGHGRGGESEIEGSEGDDEGEGLSPEKAKKTTVPTLPQATQPLYADRLTSVSPPPVPPSFKSNPTISSLIADAPGSPMSATSTVRPTPSDPDVSELTSEQKVALIIEEFGPIPGGGRGDEKEHLIAEIDASVFQDVAIFVCLFVFLCSTLS